MQFVQTTHLVLLGDVITTSFSDGVFRRLEADEESQSGCCWRFRWWCGWCPCVCINNVRGGYADDGNHKCSSHLQNEQSHWNHHLQLSSCHLHRENKRTHWNHHMVWSWRIYDLQNEQSHWNLQLSPNVSFIRAISDITIQ